MRLSRMISRRRSRRRAAAEAVGDVGEAVLVQRPGDQDAGRHRQGRGEEGPEPERTRPPSSISAPTAGRGERRPAAASAAAVRKSGDPVRIALAGQARHGQAAVEAQAGREIVAAPRTGKGRLRAVLRILGHLRPPSPSRTTGRYSSRYSAPRHPGIEPRHRIMLAMATPT